MKVDTGFPVSVILEKYRKWKKANPYKTGLKYPMKAFVAGYLQGRCQVCYPSHEDSPESTIDYKTLFESALKTIDAQRLLISALAEERMKK